MKDINDSHISRRAFLKVLGQSLGFLALGVWSKDTLKFAGTDELVKAADGKTVYKPTITPTSTMTRRPLATNTGTPTLRPTSTRVTPTPSLSPTMRATEFPTVTNTPEYTRVPTSTATFTPTVTATPDLTGYIIPSPDNFEVLMGYLATAVNIENVRQEGKDEIDMSDLVEDYLNFDRGKYEEYKKGKRPYKYLKFREYLHSKSGTGKINIQATVEVPSSIDGSSEREYVSRILGFLKDRFKVAVVNIDERQRVQIERDVAESNRLTCVKSTRFIWDLFGDYSKDGYGLFPAIFQLQIINAGELAFQSEKKVNVFAPENVSISFSSAMGGANIVAAHPEKDPEAFDGQIMVFFRPQMVEGEPGHVGICKLIAEYDPKGKFENIVVTYFEVDGNTGQAYYTYRSDLEEFRTHLYLNTPRAEGYSRYLVGWLYNREQYSSTQSRTEVRNKK